MVTIHDPSTGYSAPARLDDSHGRSAYYRRHDTGEPYVRVVYETAHALVCESWPQSDVYVR